MSVMEAIDGGYSYSAAFCGIRAQVFSQPPGDDISTFRPGEYILPRNVERSEVLFLPGTPGGLPEKQFHGQELWFSPGNGELWAMRAGGPFHVLTAPNGAVELITHIFWSHIDDELYVCTHVEYRIGPPRTWGVTRVYRVNREAGTMAVIMTWAGADPNYAEPIIDAAKFGDYIYLHCNALIGDPFSSVQRLVPSTGARTEVLNYFNDFGSQGYAGGIAVMDNKLIASDGNNAYRSADGTAWAHDFNLTTYNSWDNFDLLTFGGVTGSVYGAQNDPNAAADPLVVERTGDGAWANDLAIAPLWPTGMVALGQEYDEHGNSVALYAQRWGWGGDESPEIRRKPAGGAWMQDWEGPGTAFMGIYSQGIVQFRGAMHALFYDAWPDGDVLLCRRYRTGSWRTIKQWTGMDMLPTHAYCSGMAVAPNAAKECHEV